MPNANNGSNNNNNSNDDGRVQRNLTGLLQFALEHTKKEDASNTNAPPPMSEERKAYLEKALESMTIDVLSQFENALKTLHDESTTNEDKEDALNVVRDHICQIDFANSFIKLGGDQLLLQYAKHSSLRLRRLAISIIAETCQNNPACQKRFLEVDTLQLLIPYFLEHEDLAKAAIYATSAIIRNYEPALAKFIEIDGIEAIINCLKRNEQQIFIKSAYLVGSTAKEFVALKHEYVRKGALECLIDCLDPVSDFDVRIETCLMAIASLADSEFYQPTSQQRKAFRSRLLRIVNGCKALAQCEEMIEYANTTLKYLDEKKSS